MSANPETEEESGARAGAAYAYKPNLVGSAWEFALRPAGIEWQYGRRSGVVRYDQIRRVRMSYRPATMQTHRFITEIWSPQAPKLQISSTSFRGLLDQARQDAEYTAFVGALHQRLAAAGSPARFEGGMHPLLFWPGVAVLAAIGVALSAFLVQTLGNRDLAGAAVIVGVMLLFVWQVGTIFYRNKPQLYRPAAPPANVLPSRS